MSTSPISSSEIAHPAPIAEDTWEKTLSDYHEMSVVLYSKPYINPDKFFAQFRKLRELKPKAFEPFLPLFTFLLGNFDNERFASILTEAKECDYYLTYAVILHVLYNQLTMGVHFALPEARKIAILNSLRAAYPEDLLLPSLINSTILKRGEIIVIIKPIQTSLSNSIDALSSNNPTEALKALVPKTRALTGHSILHRYLALAWALKGSFPQAKTCLQRSTTLLDFQRKFTSDSIKELVRTCVQDAFGLPLTPIVKNGQPDLLPVLLELLEVTPSNLESALKFIHASLTALQTNCDQLPFIYFGVRHLLTHFKYTSDWQIVFYPLLELVAQTANHSHTMTPDDWMKERFKKIVSGEIIDFQIDFTKTDPKDNKPDPIPSFSFSSNLVLDYPSKHSVASATTRQLYRLIIKFIDDAITNEGIGLKHFTPPPVDPVEFRDTLENQLTKDDHPHSFYLSANYLRTYLALKNRPFLLDDQFLNWAKFCVFAGEAPCFLQSTMDREIMQSFYPKTFIQLVLDGLQRQLNLKMPILCNKKTPRDLRIAARDTLLACHDLALRAEPVLFENETLYGLYKSSKHICGWRPEESLEAWFKRLQQLHPLETGPKKTVLNFFLDFWKQFQKNLEQTRKITVSGFNKKFWHLYNNSKPAKKKINGQKQSKITPVTNGPFVETNRLKKLCKNTSMPSVQFIRLMAAALIVNAEYPSDQAVHQVSMESEEDAMLLCQYLLEVAADRLVRRAIVNMGPKELKDSELRTHLAIYLHPLIGAFKKPAHEAAPFQAAVVTNDCSLTKIAVFYPRRDEKDPSL